MNLYTYLNFGGNCEDAFRFYAQHLGGRITALMRYSDLPAGHAAPPGPPNAIVYASLSLGQTELRGSDVPGERFQSMRSAYLSLNADSTPEAERIYALLADGGEVFMPMAETFFAYRFGMLRDRFGTSWMVLHQRPAA